MAKDLFSDMAQDIDNCRETRQRVGGGTRAGLTFGGQVTDVMRRLRGAGVPWLVILQLAGLIIADLRAGKSIPEIVADIIGHFTAGTLPATLETPEPLGPLGPLGPVPAAATAADPNAGTPTPAAAPPDTLSGGTGPIGKKR